MSHYFYLKMRKYLFYWTMPLIDAPDREFKPQECTQEYVVPSYDKFFSFGGMGTEQLIQEFNSRYISVYGKKSPRISYKRDNSKLWE